ncbi:MAG: RluA family pseudouridine synthase [Candidatus Poriferisodalaceae bacterium]|nr:MAG: RNA pseudouridine synthase [Acidimicrobiales bacterium MED-G01]
MREEIPNALDGERVDRVASLMTGFSRSAIARLIADGKVIRNEEKVVNGSDRVTKGDYVEVEKPAEEEMSQALVPDASVEFEVVYEDEAVIVVDKPIGLVVHAGAGRQDSTLAHGLLARYPEVAEVGALERPGIVHRLDRDTSGLLICARTNEALTYLSEALSSREIHRSYLTIVAGCPEAPKGTIEAPIGRSRRSRTRMTVTEDGREARTHYEVLETWRNPDPASLLRCTLDTGRTHQIRVHLRAIDSPVLGDSTYGKKDPFGVGRPLLHAAEIAFLHPVSAEEMSFTSEPPADFRRALDAFRAQNPDSASSSSF